MRDGRVKACGAALAIVGAGALADPGVPPSAGPARTRIDVAAHAVPAGRDDCRLAGEVILWVTRPVVVLDEARAGLGRVEAGLAQFGSGSTLSGCVPDGAVLDLSDRFVNVVVAGARSSGASVPGRGEAAALASQLAQDFHRLAEGDGSVIPLVDGIALRAHGSVSYRFRIVLVHHAPSGSMDAVIVRETLGTKFAPRLAEADRGLSRLKWSSVAPSP